MERNKKGGIFDLPTAFIVGAGGFLIALIVVLIFIVQLNGAGLFTANSAEANITSQLQGNVTAGVANINTKIPTMFIVISVVMLLGILSMLYMYFRSKKSGPM